MENSPRGSGISGGGRITGDRVCSSTDWFFFSGVPVGQGLIDNQTLINILAKADFKGFLAVEIDHPNYEWRGREDEAVALSVEGMKRMVANIK